MLPVYETDDTEALTVVCWRRLPKLGLYEQTGARKIVVRITDALACFLTPARVLRLPGQRKVIVVASCGLIISV